MHAYWICARKWIPRKYDQFVQPCSLKFWPLGRPCLRGVTAVSCGWANVKVHMKAQFKSNPPTGLVDGRQWLTGGNCWSPYRTAFPLLIHSLSVSRATTSSLPRACTVMRVASERVEDWANAFQCIFSLHRIDWNWYQLNSKWSENEWDSEDWLRFLSGHTCHTARLFPCKGRCKIVPFESWIQEETRLTEPKEMKCISLF